MKTISERVLDLRLAALGCDEADAAAAIKRGMRPLLSDPQLAKALDEWQASVEERLASIGLGLVPVAIGEAVLASGYGKAPVGNLRGLLSLPPTQAELTAVLAAKYEPDPVESEE